MSALFVEMDDKFVAKKYLRTQSAMHEWEFVNRAAKEGLAPECWLDGNYVRMSKGVPLTETEPSYEQFIEVRGVITRLHNIGICHRDLHEGNLIIHQGVVKLIDFELACMHTGGVRCYDFHGPGDIPAPHAHLATLDLQGGVWWHAGTKKNRSLQERFAEWSR